MHRSTKQCLRPAAGDIIGNPGADAYSIAGFCAAHSISRASFYNLLKAGAAPRIMRVGTRVLISTRGRRSLARSA